VPRLSRRWFRRLALGGGAAVLAFVALVGGLWIFGPDVSVWGRRNPETTALMRYREAQTRKKTGHTPPRAQRWIPLSAVSPALIEAVVIAEDDKFFSHEGFDFSGMRDAFEKDLKAGRIVGGGSTITQQLAKNLYLSPTRNPLRKIREAVIAFELDRKLKKRRILELYLNVIEWGRGVYGAEAAARHYYAKPASALSAEEAVRLATILPNPIRYQPGNDHSKRMRQKRRIVARLLVKRHLMTPEEERLLLDALDAAAPR
jgi:monofunctional glycosyltransferase